MPVTFIPDFTLTLFVNPFSYFMIYHPFILMITPLQLLPSGYLPQPCHLLNQTGQQDPGPIKIRPFSTKGNLKTCFWIP